MFRKIASIVLALGLSHVLCAQHNTSSPYTRYGYGELVENGFGFTRSIGGQSAAIRSYSHINPGNPASFTSIDTMGFRFEFGAAVKFSSFSDNNYTQSSSDANLEYLALQLPITKRFGFSAGLQPYSFVGYDFGNKSVVNSSIDSDTLAYTNRYFGTGDISQLYFGLGANPFDNFNLGVNVHYRFGSLQHQSIVNFDDTRYHATVQTNDISVHDWSLSFGAQYFIGLPKQQKIDIGATLEMPSTLKASATRNVITALVDTVNINFDNSFGTPLTFGTGIAYEYSDRWLVGFDYSFQKWSDVEYFGEKNFNDRRRFALGGQFIPSRLSKKYLQRVAYRLGVNTSNSYYKVNNEDFNMMGVSAGFGFPLRKVYNASYLNLGFEYGRAGEKSDNLILEQYFKVSLNLTLNETWFMKRKFE